MKLAKTVALAGATLALTAPVALAGETTTTPKQQASKACKALKAELGAATFKATYGTNRNRSNAHGKCVSKMTSEAKGATSNAAKDCKAERASLGEQAFADKYGTNKNKKNAYGKCVSSKAQDEVKSDVENVESAAKACKAERKELGSAAFADKYGTNKNKRNAFGKCVSKAEAEADKAS